eukprot:GHVR01120662.1.p1 GENE.GHVR01120662.1~~GHVR01120662.1.p1  ORF type:complete len:125 (+),score=21.26 GHVR01120662.1:2249-2623(+)
MQREMNSTFSKNKESLLDIETNFSNKIVKVNEKNIEIEDTLNELSVKVNGLRTEAGSNNPIHNDKIKKINDEIEELTKHIQNVEEKAMEACGKNEEDIVRMRSDLIVLKGEVGALDDDLKKISS